MWTLWVVCSIIAAFGVQNADGYTVAYWTATQWDSPTATPTVTPTTTPTTTPSDTLTGWYSCYNNCGRHLGSCSCSSSCRYNGNCCYGYNYYCHYNTEITTHLPTTTAPPSCRYSCGWSMGSCSCSSSCQYYGNCCDDYHYYCGYSTDTIPAETTPTPTPPSCRYNCGWSMGSCSCSSSCQYYGNCCDDYHYYCYYSTENPSYYTTAMTVSPSCRYNCGRNLGSCSCSSSCRYHGTCCNDYYTYCYHYSTTVSPTIAPPSCRYNCGRHLGNCSCTSSCQYYGNCCDDYYSYCYQYHTTAPPSCRYNCGWDVGSCSCSSSCQYYGNCCRDYYAYCYYNNTTTLSPWITTQPSCRYNCGYSMGSCSCSSSCQYYGNCCHDYYSYCYNYHTTAQPCGGSLYDSGTFSSPNYPNYYPDNAFCTWYLRTSNDQRILLTFTDLQLEKCCDHIVVYDGPSTSSPLLGEAHESLQSFYSSSNYMTVRFWTDGSVVAKGFSADFLSTVSSNSGRVTCSSDKMVITIERSYLNSLGFDYHSLYLNDPDCRPAVSSYQVVFSFPIESCGNVRTFENGTVVYTNTLRAYENSSGEITRQSHLKLNVGCRMDQDSVSHIMYLVHHRGNSTIVGTGRFNTTMAFYTSSGYKVTEVPYKVTLNQDLLVRVDLNGDNDNLAIFLDTCVTSPSPDDFTTRAYYLIREGCPMDYTFRTIYNGYGAYARFAFKAFQFLRAHESVYIQCKVLICPKSDVSRCRLGCTRRKRRDLGSRRDSQTVILGPIQLKDPESKMEGKHEQEKA